MDTYTYGVISLTPDGHAPPLAQVFHRAALPTSSASSKRSPTRKCERPAEITTKGSAATTLVHRAGRERSSIRLVDVEDPVLPPALATMIQLELLPEQRVKRVGYPKTSLRTIRIGCIRQPSPIPTWNDSCGPSKRSVSTESSCSARATYASSSRSTSSTTIARETTRDSTISCCNGRHHHRTRAPRFNGANASVGY